MQNISLGDNLQELSSPVFWKKNNKKKIIINLSSADSAQRLGKVIYVSSQ